MNDHLEMLEQSILQHDASGVAHQNLSFGERHPVFYLGAMLLFAMLAYSWLFLFPLSFIALTAYIPYAIYQASHYLAYAVVLLEVILAGVAAWMTYEIWKLPVPYPVGRPLNQDEAPVLRTMIDDLCKKHHVPRIQRIRIIRDYSIELVRTPERGFPFTYTSSLLIGMPLMQSLSARYLMAAIEREIVHLSGVHKRPASMLYFMRQLCVQYQLAWRRNWALPSLIMRAFFAWYTPLFKLLSPTACRMQQYYADKKVQSALRDQTLVNMLVTTIISKHYLENDFWPHLYNKAYRHKQPPYLPYASLDHNLRAKLDNDNAQAWLNAEMTSTSSTTDTPSLKQRLEQLAVFHVSLPPPVTESAAKYFLGDSFKVITGQLDQVWFKTHEFEWQQKYQQGLQQQQRLRILIMQTMQSTLTNDTAWELIQLAKQYLGDDGMLPMCKQVLQNNLSEARIYFDIGRTLLVHADVEGVAALERAMQLDEGYTVIACQLITKYYVNTGNSKSAQNFRRRALAYQVNAA